jgi:putative heme-binding domain-containing protein
MKKFDFNCYLNTPQAAEARQSILFKDLQDPWVQISALSAISAGDGKLMDAVLKNYDSLNPAYANLVERLSSMTGTRGDTLAMKALISRALSSSYTGSENWRSAILQGLAKSIRHVKGTPKLYEAKKILLQTALTHTSAELRSASLKLLNTIGLPQGKETEMAMQKSVAVAVDQKANIDKRNDAIHFLSLHNPSKYDAVLKKLIAPNEPKSIQSTALRTLSAIPGEGVSHFILEKWASLTPNLRDEAINTFMSSEIRIKLLLDGLENGTIDQESIGWPRSVGLMAQGNEALRNRSRALLTKKDNERSSIIKKYANALNLKGNTTHGKLVFQKNCSVCHQVGGTDGVSFGPDLGTIRNRRPESILGDILDPNLSIADGFDIWIIELKNGQSVQGLIATETPTAITVNNYGNQKTVIARKDIKTLKALGMSSMPAGLEAEIDQQSMADLLAFIKQPK